jgi:hypothetical protein
MAEALTVRPEIILNSSKCPLTPLSGLPGLNIAITGGPAALEMLT